MDAAIFELGYIYIYICNFGSRPRAGSMAGCAASPLRHPPPRILFKSSCILLVFVFNMYLLYLTYAWPPAAWPPGGVGREILYTTSWKRFMRLQNALELRQKLLYTTPSGWWWWWWCVDSLFRRRAPQRRPRASVGSCWLAQNTFNYLKIVDCPRYVKLYQCNLIYIYIHTHNFVFFV